nr:DEAD/DEAH box helicase family protein [Paenibacillus sp. O199]
MIDIFTYQKVENRLGRENNATLKDEYGYIVCDEFHYFLTESIYNSRTEDSFKLIMSHSNKTRIFMSATADITIDFFKFKDIEYRSYYVPHDYSHIKELLFYRDEKVLEKYLSKVRKGYKAIAFFTQATKAYELHKRFEDSMFVCAEGNAEFKKYINKDQIRLMLTEETFNEKYLFTTSTLDNGINLRDQQLKYIVCDIQDVDVLIQCLGRKRIIDTKDKVTVVIKNITDKEIGQKIKAKNQIINPTQYLLENGSMKYIEKYPRYYSNPLVYDKLNKDKTGYDKAVNELRFFKECSDKKNLELLLENQDGYLNHIKTKLQKENFIMLDEKYEKATLEDYLDERIGHRLYKEEQMKLAKKINLTDGRSRLQKSCNSFNTYFYDNCLPYTIKDKNIDQRRVLGDGSNNPNYKKSYWLIAKFSVN